MPAAPRERRTFEDPQVTAINAHAAANERLALAIENFTTEIKPGIEAVSGLFNGMKAIGDFFVRRRVMILGSIPLVLSLIGGVSPNVAKIINSVLAYWGVI